MSVTHVPAELRRLGRQRAQDCCEYCLIPESITFAAHEVDHLIAEKHGGQTHESNLALSCALCNGFKGSDLTSIDPDTGNIVPLFHPRRDAWTHHFQLLDGPITAITPVGRVTVRLLQLNHPSRIEERRQFQAAGLIS